MKKFLLLLFFTVSAVFVASAQQAISVLESTFKLGAFDSKDFYYAFAQGDKLSFSFQETAGNELKEVEIIEMPSSVKFADYKCKRIDEKTISVSQTGVYRFHFSNSAMTKRVCNISIKRTPATSALAGFNTKVETRILKDTLFVSRSEIQKGKTDTLVQEIYNSTLKVQPFKPQIIEFVLPENTFSWSFYIGVGSKGQAEYNRAKNAFLSAAGKAAYYIPEYGPMANLALTGVSYFNQLQGEEDNVKYCFLPGPQSVKAYKAKKTFQSYKSGNVINEAAQMKAPLHGHSYLALENDNLLDPITVSLHITTVSLKENWTNSIVKEWFLLKK